MESFTVWDVIAAGPEALYEAWLSSDEHAAFTGAEADIDPKVGGEFNVWDGYIQGITVELEPYRRIVQKWRTTEFPQKAEDSRLEILLEEVKGGTKITLNHSNIPDGQSEEYKQGWTDYYFEPLKEYFKK